MLPLPADVELLDQLRRDGMDRGLSPDVTVRSATVADARAIAQVLVNGWKSTYAQILPADFLDSLSYQQHEANTRELLQNLPTSIAAFVAAHDADIVGVALVRVTTDDDDFAAELDALYVLAGMQRHQIGSRLLRHVVRWLSERGHASLRLWVLRDNPYRRFYDGIGGELLRDERQDEFGGASVVSVGYGWRNLEALAERLEARVS